MAEVIRLTRGATFRHRFVLPRRVETYTAMRAQVMIGAARVDLDLSPKDDTAHVYVSADAAVTAEWPLRLAPVSLRVMVGAEVAHTETIYIHIIPEVTSND